MNRIKELRKEKGLTQKELANIAEVSKRTLIYWENGESQIKPDKAEKLADFFGVSISVLLGYRDESDSLGFRLWSLRNQKGIELEKVASDLKLSIDELKLIEQTDNAELGNALAKDFADYYNVSVEYLLGYKTIDDIRAEFENENLWDFAIFMSHLGFRLTDSEIENVYKMLEEASGVNSTLSLILEQDISKILNDKNAFSMSSVALERAKHYTDSFNYYEKIHSSPNAIKYFDILGLLSLIRENTGALEQIYNLLTDIHNTANR